MLHTSVFVSARQKGLKLNAKHIKNIKQREIRPTNSSCKIAPRYRFGQWDWSKFSMWTAYLLLYVRIYFSIYLIFVKWTLNGISLSSIDIKYISIASGRTIYLRCSFGNERQCNWLIQREITSDRNVNVISWRFAHTSSVNVTVVSNVKRRLFKRQVNVKIKKRQIWRFTSWSRQINYFFLNFFRTNHMLLYPFNIIKMNI